MRIRNNKVNVFLSDDDKFILKRDSSKIELISIWIYYKFNYRIWD